LVTSALVKRTVRQPSQHSFASLVMLAFGSGGMRGAIEFNDKASFDASEVSDVRFDRMLAAEFETVELSAAEFRPEDGFGVRHFAAELLCEMSRISLGQTDARRRPLGPRFRGDTSPACGGGKFGAAAALHS
jgi:hypothetical protein